MKFAAAAAVVATALLLGAAAPKPPTSPWARKPTRERLLAVLPPESARPQGGFAAMRCKVGADGGMVDCQVIQEYPVGSGFGRVLRSLAPDYQMKPPAEGGVAPGGEVVIPGDWLPFDKASDWKRRPSPEDMVVVWPKKAWARGAGGRAIINCLVSVQGALFDCFVAAESPAGEHFGDAGIALTPQFMMRPATLRGQPVVSTVRIPLNFEMPEGGLEPPSSFGSRQSVLPVMAWPEAPSYAAVAAAYPKKARANNLGGRATLDCQFTKEGRLTGCSTVAEEPRGQGFGDAAKALAKQFRAFATTSDGSPVSRAAIQLPVIFDPVMLTDASPVIG
ncbi:MAG: hypothetical protein JWQ29_3312, partial [Phenylobacterium sp.]|nr:hypothetical protein [Phenylobacterium sp.]